MSDTPQARRPLSCICALCDCGVHNCADYEALAARKRGAAPAKEGQPTKSTRRIQRQQQDDDRQSRQFRQTRPETPVGQPAAEHGQVCRQPVRARSPVDRQPETAQARAAMESSGRRAGDNYDDRDYAYANDDQQECRCLGDDERYLASQLGAPTKFKSADELKAFNLDSEHQEQELPEPELMHVLVTRPEIASKPRDNILFEGDMDLKTTFETSYEALAKMRLDHWRRFQDQQAQQVAKAGARTGGRGGGCARKQQPLPAATMTKRATATTARRHPSLGVAVAAAPKATDGEQGVSVAKGRRAKATLTTAAPATMTATKAPEKVRADDESLPNAAASEAAGEHAAPGSKQVAAAALKPAAAFGAADDASTAAAPATVTTKPAQTSHQPQRRVREEIVVARNIDPDLSPIIVYDANMNRLETMGLRRRSKYRPSTSLHTGARGMFGDQEPETDSRQQQQPAEREGAAEEPPLTGRSPQELADHPKSPSAKEEPETPTHSLQRQMAASESPFFSPEISQKTELALNVRNLKDSNQGDYLSFSEHNLPVNSKRKVRDNVNMHDHIKEQNIVETSNWTEKKYDRVVSNGHSLVSARASPQTKQHYNNLFSESPDFIRTTGKFLYEEAKGLSDGGKTNGQSSQLETTVEPNELLTGGIIDDYIEEENPPECRVFKLDDDFDYIGTRLGHRYYTEKHPELGG